jgi:transposase
MKKGNSSQRSPKRVVKGSGAKRLMTIGMYLGDKSSCYSVLDRDGEVVREASVGTTKKAMTQVFGSLSRCRIAIEVGTHSPWVSRLL